MKEKTLAEQLVKCLPEEWKAFTVSDGSFVYVDGYYEDENCIWTDGKYESPWFINWALDELAAKSVEVEMTGNTDGWQVRVHEVGDRENHYEVFIGDGPTKTLALAHAIVALGDVNG